MPPFCAHAENRPRLCEPGAVLNLELFKGEEAVEHDGDLSAGGVALCGEGRLAGRSDAGDDAAALTAICIAVTAKELTCA